MQQAAARHPVRETHLYAHPYAQRWLVFDPFPTILEQVWEPGARAGHRGRESAANRRDLVSVQVGKGPLARAANVFGVERAEAEAILDGDRETAIGLLLRLDDLVAANERLVEANERLEARVAELERRLNRSSRNSSLPPSQDPPSAPPRPGGKGSGRKRGGQHGHEGRYRRLLPSERVDEFVEHWPERCRSCAREFAEAERVDAAEPSRRQVAELPPIAVRVTEHRLHRVCCPECAAVRQPSLLPSVSRGRSGRRLQAAVVTLAVRNRVSRRDTTELARRAVRGRALDRGGRRDRPARRRGARRPHTRLEQEIKTVAGRQHRRDRLEDRRRPPDALGRAHPPNRGVPDRGRPARLRGADHARRTLRRDRLLRPLARLRLPRPHPPPALLGAPAPRLHRPQRRDGRTRRLRIRRPGRSPTTCSRPGSSSSTTATEPRFRPGSRHCKTSSAPSSSTPPARAPRPSTTASSPATSSNAGPPSGHSPTPTASSRPTTTPNAASAAPSSTASSHSAPNPNAANAASNDSSPPRSPAGSANNRSSPTSPRSSPPTPAATQYPPSADSPTRAERLPSSRCFVCLRVPARARPDVRIWFACSSPTSSTFPTWVVLGASVA